MDKRRLGAGMTEAPNVGRQVAWALHCWSCPLCFVNGFDAMANSDQDHVTESEMQQAHFLTGALGLVQLSEGGSTVG